VLVLLANRSGELITREELRQAIWGDHTVVDFEHGLNTCIRQVRVALGEGAEEAAIIETVPRLGYRFKPTVTRVASPHRRTGRQTAGLALAAAILLVIAAAFARTLWTSQQDQHVRVAVLRFTTPDGSPDDEILAIGLAEDLIGRLNGFARARVTAKTSSFSIATGASPQEIGARLDVEGLVVGELRRAAENLDIQVRVMRAADGRELWTERFIRPFSEVFVLQDLMAAGIAQALRLGAPRSAFRWPTANPRAYALYVRGRLTLDDITVGGGRSALQLFEDAVALDPNYAQAHAGIAEAYSVLSFAAGLAPQKAYTEASRAAKRALSLNDAVPETQLALAAVRRFERDWTGAERAFRRAVALDPNNAAAHTNYGMLLSLQGRFSEALEHVRIATSLDPISARARWMVATVLLYGRQYDDCIRELEHTLQLDPNYGQAYHLLGQCHQWQGQLDRAIPAYERAGLATRGNLAHAYAAAGRRDDARRVLEEMERGFRETGVGATSIAIIYIGFGEIDRAFAWLATAYQNGGWLGTLKVAPVYDPIRSDPRFTDLLQKMGLAGEGRGSSSTAPDHDRPSDRSRLPTP
jgi:TolB-like protein/Tfp pilus assembly protein PilF